MEIIYNSKLQSRLVPPPHCRREALLYRHMARRLYLLFSL